MKNKVNILLVIVLIISIISNIHSVVKNSTLSSIKSFNHERHFSALVDNISAKFEVEGYVEVLDGRNQVLILPNNAKDMTFYDHSRMFVFKNNAKNSVIMLEVSQSNSNGPNAEEWIASFDYSSNLYNKKDEEFFNENLPEILLSTHSFRYHDFYFTSVCFTDGEDHMLSPNELTAFTNHFILFLESNI